MMSSLYIGATGLKTHGEGLGVIGHNIANVGTIGYKQQSMLFDDIFYATGPSGGGWEAEAKVALSQTGMGARPGAVRTLFSQGPIEDGVGIFDLAILGKGFFEVSDDNGRKYYTRAGDFHLDKTGTLRDANNYAVTGIPIASDASAPAKGPLSGGGPVIIDVLGECPPRATTRLTLSMNLGISGNNTQDDANPYFSLLEAWDSAADPPLGASAYGYAQPVTLYDATGQRLELTLYVDGAPDPASGGVMEYILARAPDDPSQAVPGEGLYMAGTLTFSGDGGLLDMSAFVPETVSRDPADWIPAPLANGLPQFGFNGLPVALDLGIQAQGGWQHPPASALDVGTDRYLLPSMGQVSRRADASTAYGTSSFLIGNTQDGYGRGALMDVDITAKGVVVGVYSNGQNLELYQIPLCRFTSEDGLRHEGNNLFSAPSDKTGPMEMGVPDTENYGAIMADHIEGSNVELSREITLMIMMQRGFQMNSKTITTSDTMLQRAIELKRS
jgi:flagellar hook protein FlgE